MDPRFLAAGDQLEEQVLGVGLKRQAAELVDGQQAGSADLRELVLEPGLTLRPSVRCDHSGPNGAGGECSWGS
jgi:hypothetical protein